MTEKWLEFVEIGVAIVTFLASIFAIFQLRRNAEKHEQSAEDLDKKIKRAIN